MTEIYKKNFVKTEGVRREVGELLERLVEVGLDIGAGGVSRDAVEISRDGFHYLVSFKYFNNDMMWFIIGELSILRGIKKDKRKLIKVRCYKDNYLRDGRVKLEEYVIDVVDPIGFNVEVDVDSSCGYAVILRRLGLLLEGFNKISKRERRVLRSKNKGGHMNIKKFKIDGLEFNSYNPRKDLKPGQSQYEALNWSVVEFGYVEPIVVNIRNNRIVGGHQRVKVLKELGYKDE